MTLQVMYGLAAQAVLVAWITAQLVAAVPSRQRRLITIGAAILSLVPAADGVSAAMALRALWGDPSATTLQLLLCSLAGRPVRIGRTVAGAFALFAVAFYAAALGLGDFDPYRLGYSAAPLVAGLGLAAFIAWQRGQPQWLWLLAIDLGVFATGLPESSNFWDALFDPLLMMAAIGLALRPARK